MIFYDWNKISRVTKKDPKKLKLLIGHIMTGKRRLISPLHPNLWLFTNTWKGDSFLIHPEILLHNLNSKNLKYLPQYLELASYRSFIDYKLMKKTYLDYLPMYGTEINNPFLVFNDNKIYFKFEGETN